MIDVAAIPDRLENAVGKAEDQDVLNGFFAEVMIDAVDLFFREDLSDFAVQRYGRFEVRPEGLLDHDATPVAVLFGRETLVAQSAGRSRQRTAAGWPGRRRRCRRCGDFVQLGDTVFQLDVIVGISEVAR